MKYTVKLIELSQDNDLLSFCYMLEKNHIQIDKINLIDLSLIIQCHHHFIKYIKSHDMVLSVSTYFETPDFLKLEPFNHEQEHVTLKPSDLKISSENKSDFPEILPQYQQEIKKENMISSDHHSYLHDLPINKKSQANILKQQDKKIYDNSILIPYDYFIDTLHKNNKKFILNEN